MAKSKGKAKKKAKKTLAIKSTKIVGKKISKVSDIKGEAVEDVSLIERARRESEEVHTSRGNKREVTRMVFALWLNIPVRYRGAPDTLLAQLGIEGELLEIARISNVEEFKRVCNVGHQAMADWRKEIEQNDDVVKERKKLFRRLMNEGLGALYRKLIENGDAERFKIFANYVEGWVPGMAVEHTVSTEISAERKAALDELLRKNGLQT